MPKKNQVKVDVIVDDKGSMNILAIANLQNAIAVAGASINRMITAAVDIQITPIVKTAYVFIILNYQIA